MKKTAFLFILSLSLVFQSLSQPGKFNGNMPKDGKITGRVIDETTRHGVAYASISLHSEKDSSIVGGTITDNGGYFEMSNLAYGKYYAWVTFIGYEKVKIPEIHISPKQKEVILGNISIKESSLVLNEVEISTDKRHIEYKVDKKVINVTQDIIAAGGTAVDVLENTPSVQVDVDGNLTLRGSGSYTVLIDGKPSVLSGSDALKQISASTIEKIEIITNPSAKYDPDGIGGIINIILKKSITEGFNGIINAGVGMFKNYSTDGTFNLRTGKVNLFAGYDLNKRGGPGKWINEREADFDTVTIFTNADADRSRNFGGYSIKTGLDWEINKVNFMTFSADYGQRNFGFTGNSRYHEYTQPVIYDYYYLRDNLSSNTHNTFNTNLYYQHKFLQPNHDFSASVNYSLFSGDNYELNTNQFSDSLWNGIAAKTEDRATSEVNGNTLRFKADYVRPFSSDIKIETGVQARMFDGNSVYKYENKDTLSGNWFENTERRNDVEFFNNIFSAYATFSDKMFGFEYMAGIRAEYNDRKIVQHILNREYPYEKLDFFPSFHISKQLVHDQQILASYSRKTERPDEMSLDPFPRYMDKNTIRIGNPALRPEFVNSFELAYQKRFNGTFFSAEAYYRETYDKISRTHYLTDSNVMVMIPQNINRDYAAGLELMGTFDIKKFITINASTNLYQYHLEGNIEEQDVVKDNFTWNARLTASFRFPWGMRVQLMTSYRAKDVTINGTQLANLNSSIGIRQDFFKRKLSAAIQIRDFLGNSRFGFTSQGQNYTIYTRFDRAWPVVSGTLTYTFNNYKRRQDRQEEMDMNQMDMF